MMLNTDCMVSIEDVNNDFSKAAGVVDSAGMAVIIKDNKPRYVLLDFSEFVAEQNDSGENIKDIAGRVLKTKHASIEEISKNNATGDGESVNSITLNDILNLSDGNKADDVFRPFNSNISEETTINADRTPDENSISVQAGSENTSADAESNVQSAHQGEEFNFNLNSYSEHNVYLDEATKKTIAELKELLKGKE